VKYGHGLWNTPPPRGAGEGVQEYAEMRVKIVSQVHIIRNKLGNMYTVAVACAGLYIIYYFYTILNKTVMNQQSFIALTSNKFPCTLIQPFSVDIPDRFPGGKGGRCVRLTFSPPSCAECHENPEA
jgi:hypothetical protein